MTHEEILTKSIEKAVKNGWNMFGFAGKLSSWNIAEQEFAYQPWLYGRMDERLIYQLRVSLNDIIFSHEFAKAFWRDAEPVEYCSRGNDVDTERQEPFQIGEKMHNHVLWTKDIWAYHLQQMVLEDDPIAYLEAFLTPLAPDTA